MSFDISPKDLGIGTEVVKAVQTVAKKPPEDDVKNYLKNVLDTVKTAKSAAKETLDLLGFTPEEARNMIKQKIGFQPQQQQQAQQPAPAVRARREVEQEVKQQIQEQPKQEKKMELDFDKILKKSKLVVKFLKAENMKVSEFIKEIEENKEDIKELFE